ncbi:hypothetical protein HETIRDRAFT_101131 [Heterobasidion irregulare TC 32-1]|uniref:Uncharacterized protein n=1 Tax=Heterobasidion irregulare (strain TC 32-1) TaxID=747525 RepID=W4KJ54_HETIT|nr:uncharacterized protein HETIRDRAFT_101131 [Heterobasidion irregulare TC 32-1]ETW85101.1 hypothetical protein HETIRDRAFT_101131 [Heterobasidion irregulare TC 32-1]
MVNLSSSSKIRKKGPTAGKYMDQKDASLALALSIGEAQEDRTRQKVGKINKAQKAPKDDRKTRSAAQTKLKDATAILLARKCDAKKAKTKLRRESKRKQSRANAVDISVSNDAQSTPIRKKVSFA